MWSSYHSRQCRTVTEEVTVKGIVKNSFLLRLELFSVFSRRNTKFFLEGVGEMVLTAETNILRNLFDSIFGEL